MILLLLLFVLSIQWILRLKRRLHWRSWKRLILGQGSPIAAHTGGNRWAWLVAVPGRTIAHESRSYGYNLLGNRHAGNEGSFRTIEGIWRRAHGSARLLSLVVDWQVLGLGDPRWAAIVNPTGRGTPNALRISMDIDITIQQLDDACDDVLDVGVSVLARTMRRLGGTGCRR